MSGLKEYLKFLDTLNEAIIVYNRDEILWANRNVCNMMGYASPEDVIGSSPHSHVHTDDLIDLEKNFKVRYDEDQKTSEFWRIRSKDGSYKTVLSHGSTYSYGTNKVLVSIFREKEDRIISPYSASTIQHALLTPLTVAKGYVEILKANANSALDIKYLDQMMESCMRLEENIKKVIELLEQFNTVSS